MKNEILKVENVSKSFGDKLALNNLSLSVHTGEIVALVGPNGSGKTTLMRTILNLYKDNSGYINIRNKDVKKNFEDVGPFVGTMIEESGIYELLTAEEYLKFILSIISNYSKEDIDIKVEDTLKKVNMYDHRKKILKTFSKGMIQRIAFARAIINNPILLILDEPFDGIDIETKVQLLDIIRKDVVDKGILITSHNLNEIESICDRIIIIKNGSILFDDTPENLRNKNNFYSKLKIKFNLIHDKDSINSILGSDYCSYDDNVFEFNIKNQIEKELIFNKISSNNLKIDDIYEKKVSLEELYLNIVNK